MIGVNEIPTRLVFFWRMLCGICARLMNVLIADEPQKDHVLGNSSSVLFHFPYLSINLLPSESFTLTLLLSIG
jgi:hypothetical protein